MPSTLQNRMKMKSVRMNGKYFLPPSPDIVAHHAGDELVAHLGDRLQAARHQRGPGGRADQKRHDRDDDKRHEQRRIRIGNIDRAEVERNRPLNRELLKWSPVCRHVPRPRPRRIFRVAPASLARRRPGIAVPDPLGGAEHVHRAGAGPENSLQAPPL